MQEAEKINYEKSRVDINSLDWWIHFAVDNNIQYVLLNYAAAGYTDVAISPETLKDRLSDIAKSNPRRAASIINVPIVRATNNWTTDVIEDYDTGARPGASAEKYGWMGSGTGIGTSSGTSSGNKINWANVGSAALSVGSVLLGLFTGQTNPSQTPSPNTPPQDNTETILGLQKNVFYITMGVVVVLMGLIFYIATKK